MATPNVGNGSVVLAAVQATGAGVIRYAGAGSATLAALHATGSIGRSSPVTSNIGAGDVVLAAVRSDGSGGSTGNVGAGSATLAAVRAQGVGHAKTYGTRPEDFCLLTPTVDLNGEVTSYTLASSPVPYKTNDEGATIAPTTVYALPTRLDETDPYDIEEIEVDGTVATHTLVKVSRRMSMPTHWQTKVGDGEWVSWLRHHGNGQQLGFNEDYRERFGLGYNGGSIVHNPTFGGGIDDFTNFLMPTAGEGLRFSPQVFYEATGGVIGTARVRACVIPMHFSPDGTGQSSGNTIEAEWDHGGELGVTDVMFWDQRQYFDLELAYGDEAVHKLSFWSYQREGWNATDHADAMPYYGAVSFGGALADIFDQCYVVDLENETILDATPFLVSPYGLQAVISKATVDLTVWEGPFNGRSYFPSPVPSGYAAIIMRRSSDDFCVAIATRLHDHGDGCRRASTIGFATFRNLFGTDPNGLPPYPGYTTTQDEALYGPSVTVGATDTERADGWCGIFAFYVTGLSYADTLAKLYLLHAAGGLAVQPSTDLPDVVVSGTVGISSYYIEETVAQTTAETLWAAVVEAYDESGLVSLTNIRDRSATSINTAAGVVAAQSVIDLWPVYAQAAYDSSDAAQVEVGRQAVIAMLWRRGGTAATIAQIKWEEVFSPDGLIAKVRKMGARGRVIPKSNSGVSQKAETTSGGRNVRGWADRASLPTNFLPRRVPAED